MILAIPEYDDYPASPVQWDRFYHTLDDLIYIQTVETTDPSYPNWVQMAEGAAVRDDMRHEITLTRSKYSAKDYQTFLDETVAYISERWGDQFNDFMSSEPAMMIAEYVSAAFDQLSWYLDRETDDHYMALARIRSNVARLARYLGYKPAPAVAASVDLVVTLPSGPYGFDVTLKAGHQFEGPNGLVFELGEDQVIPSGDTEKTIGVYQGQSFTEVFISNGEENQGFDLSLVPDGENVALEKTYLTVDLDEWSEEDFLPYGSEEAYEISYLTAPPRLRFGDGVIGKIPPSGSEVRVSYVATAGKSAGFATSGTIEKSLTTVVVNFQQIPLSVTNPNPASGGFDAESMEETKANAPRYFLTADRLVTQGDYESTAGTYRGASGAVAMANAIIIRGVEQDLELKALMDAITADREQLDAYLDGIKANQDAIIGYTGTSSTEDTIRYFCLLLDNQATLVKAKVDEMDTLVTTVQGNITDCKSDVDAARSQLDFVPFQELVGLGDGSTTLFAKTLAKRPITEGSLAVIVSNPTPIKSGTDGDCDATPGRMTCSDISPTFTASDKGKTIRIGGEFRQITKSINDFTIEYSGPRIYGTSLLIDVLPSAIVGYDDGAGSVSGNGLTGTINYTSGQLALTFTTAPEGISGQYGVPILTTYQYKAEGIQAHLDNADVDADLASTNTDTFTTYGADLDGYADEVTANSDKVKTLCDSVDTSANDTISKAESAATIPDQIQNDIDAAYEYLDTIISGNCKANVVRVSILTLDANGFYTGPSLALIGDVKTHLDERKIVTVQNSVVSGAYYLVKVTLNIALAIKDQYTFQKVSGEVATVVDTMFKGRTYQQHLLRSEYYGIIDAVTGVDYSNNTIGDIAYADPNNTGTPPSPDSNGNLYIGDYEVITKWAVNITQIS